MATTSEANALGYNLQVDYVVCYSFGDVGESCVQAIHPVLG
jgi:hypothetical protein